MSTDNRPHQVDLVDYDGDCENDGHVFDGDGICVRCDHEK